MSNNRKRVVVVGLGRQGWAVIRQLLKLWQRGNGYEIYVYDVNEAHEETVLSNYSRISRSIKRLHEEAYPIVKKLRDENADLRLALKQIEPHLLINASVFTGNEFYTTAAFEIGCDYIDLGQNTWLAIKQRALNQRIREAQKRVRIIPECGLAPGLVNILGAWLLQSGGDSLQMRVGGLPIDTHKGGDLHYGLSWSPQGLIQEYTDAAIARKDGRITSIIGLYSNADRESPLRSTFGVAPFAVNNSDLCKRLIQHMEPTFFGQTPGGGWAIQNLEARPTSDGSSLMPFDPAFAGISDLEYKTLRFYPHFDQIESMVHANSIELLGSLPPASPDMVLLRVWVEQDGTILRNIEAIILGDANYQDGPSNDVFAFTAMQHLTGWPVALVADALLNYDVAGAGHQLYRADEMLWSGQSLHSALRNGGVIMPYELVSGSRILDLLNSDFFIPEREFRVSL